MIPLILRSLFGALVLLTLATTLADSERKNGFDLANSIIDTKLILLGGPPKDGIPSIDNPVFLNAGEANLQDKDRIIGVSLNGIAKAYPLRILNWHEIVNDVVGGVPLAVTFCPLCGTGVVFEAKVNGKALNFGVSGLLYNSDVLLYDRNTESLWSQILAESVTGPLAGSKLALHPSRLTSWKDWKTAHPKTQVLSEETGYHRNYQKNPYAGYESVPEIFFPVENDIPGNYHPKEVVLGVGVNGKYKAYPSSELEKVSSGMLIDQVNGTEITVFWDSDNASGHVAKADGRAFPFLQAFWFAWFAFHPETEIFRQE